MLHDDHCVRTEICGKSPCSLGVGVVVEGHLLALVECGQGPPWLRSVLPVERGGLMWILAVAKTRHLTEWDDSVITDPAHHGSVVARGVEEGFGSESPSPLRAQSPILDGLRHVVILIGRHNNSDVVVVLGGRPDHRRTADVDLLDDFRLGGIAGADRLPKGIEIADHEVEALDPVGGEILVVDLTPGQNPAVDSGVEGLHPPTEYLRRSCDLTHTGHFEPGLLKGRRGASRGDDLVSRGQQTLDKRSQVGLVVNTHQGPHRQPTWRPSTVRSPRTRARTTVGYRSCSSTWIRAWRLSTVSPDSTRTERWAMTGP